MLAPRPVLGLLAVLAATPASVPATAAEIDEDRVKALVLEAIRERPEIVREAIEELQRREVAAEAQAARQAVVSNRATLERDPNAPTLGAVGGTAVVEFFDYNCPYCKRAVEPVKTLMEEDGDVRLVMREFPILGPGSLFAARAALAAREQGRYEDMHWALMTSDGRVTEPLVRQTAERLGLDMDRLEKDMRAPKVEEHIATSMRLAQELGINGTPSFVVGDEMAPGLVPLDRLRQLVAAARERPAVE